MDDEPDERDTPEADRPIRTTSRLNDIIKVVMMANGFFCIGYAVLLGTNRDPLGLAAHHWVLLSVMGLVGLVYLGAS